MKPRHVKCLAHFGDPPEGSIDVRESVYMYIYKEKIVREHLTGPQHYPDNGLVSGTRGEVSRNQEEELSLSSTRLMHSMELVQVENIKSERIPSNEVTSICRKTRGQLKNGHHVNSDTGYHRLRPNPSRRRYVSSLVHDNSNPHHYYSCTVAITFPLQRSENPLTYLANSHPRTRGALWWGKIRENKHN
ncbi:hypothetical protein AVEN_34678-1 [Araneus ventricosus]|uniref:Uncharacterized protein n=1 Tax=Araneus ventricosus TaxID=182803 RepID=A0A4Y2B239_ARAVE|nr:hypothetical protein AVEN_34678-1 [Araneus ventricosus]